jgi:hypothetical protein
VLTASASGACVLDRHDGCVSAISAMCTAADLNLEAAPECVAQGSDSRPAVPSSRRGRERKSERACLHLGTLISESGFHTHHGGTQYSYTPMPRRACAVRSLSSAASPTAAMSVSHPPALGGADSNDDNGRKKKGKKERTDDNPRVHTSVNGQNARSRLLHVSIREC